jgi:hypothetical protein
MYALCFLGYGTGKKLFCDDDAFEKLKLTQIGEENRPALNFPLLPSRALLSLCCEKGVVDV